MVEVVVVFFVVWIRINAHTSNHIHTKTHVHFSLSLRNPKVFWSPRLYLCAKVFSVICVYCFKDRVGQFFALIPLCKQTSSKMWHKISRFAFPIWHVCIHCCRCRRMFMCVPLQLATRFLAAYLLMICAERTSFCLSQCSELHTHTHLHINTSAHELAWVQQTAISILMRWT